MTILMSAICCWINLGCNTTETPQTELSAAAPAQPVVPQATAIQSSAQIPTAPLPTIPAVNQPTTPGANQATAPTAEVPAAQIPQEGSAAETPPSESEESTENENTKQTTKAQTAKNAKATTTDNPVKPPVNQNTKIAPMAIGAEGLTVKKPVSRTSYSGCLLAEHQKAKGIKTSKALSKPGPEKVVVKSAGRSGMQVIHQFNHPCCLKANVQTTVSPNKRVAVIETLSGTACKCICNSTIKTVIGVESGAYDVLIRQIDRGVRKKIHEQKIKL